MKIVVKDATFGIFLLELFKFPICLIEYSFYTLSNIEYKKSRGPSRPELLVDACMYTWCMYP